MINTTRMDGNLKTHAERGLERDRAAGMMAALLVLWASRFPELGLFGFAAHFTASLVSLTGGLALRSPHGGRAKPSGAVLRRALPTRLTLPRITFAMMEERAQDLAVHAGASFTAAGGLLGRLEITEARERWVDALDLLVEASAWIQLKRLGEGGAEIWQKARAGGTVEALLEAEARRLASALIEIWAVLGANEHGELAMVETLAVPRQSPREIVAAFFALDLEAPGAREAFEEGQAVSRHEGSVGHRLFGEPR